MAHSALSKEVPDHPINSPRRIRLVCVISSLAAGGAQRVLSTLANHWAGHHYDVTILTLAAVGEQPFFPLDSRIRHTPLGMNWHSVNASQGLWNNIRRLSLLRSAFRSCAPDLVISFMPHENILTLLAASSLALPVIISERTDLRVSPVKKTWALLRRGTYFLARRIVFQTESVRDAFADRYRAKSVVIRNPVCAPPPYARRERSDSSRVIVALGRLSREKGFDLLIRAFAQVKDRYPDWHLTILGEGALRGEMEDLCRSLGLGNRIDLPGAINDPYPFLQSADLFVLPSRYEGFPNALCEAMACGLPVIATDCGPGPREIVSHGVNGLLAQLDKVESLTVCMDRLMASEVERKTLGAHASLITERYRPQMIFTQWDLLVHELCPRIDAP